MKFKDLRCSCGKSFVWEHVKFRSDLDNITYSCPECSQLYTDNDFPCLTDAIKEFLTSKNDPEKMKMFIEGTLGKKWVN